jgi:hypothetical protein
MKNTVSLILMVCAFCLSSFPVLAQPVAPPVPFDAIPLDGGASLLIAAGVGFGVKKIIDYRKAQKQK